MKIKLLFLATIGLFSANAQTTHNLTWERNITGTGNADVTIETGDTVIWTWGDPNHTVENEPSNSVETFNSGTLGPVGSTYSYTFTTIGSNDYFCGIHGATNMSGTITVTEVLGVTDTAATAFNIEQNPVNSHLNIALKHPILNGDITIYNLLGNVVKTIALNNSAVISLDVSKLETGLYLIAMRSENKMHTKRFIKK